MDSLKQYFQTDWSAMTLHDWLGLGITIVVFLFMIALYVYVLHPSNKQKLESYRHIPLDEDDFYNDTYNDTYKNTRENTP